MLIAAPNGCKNFLPSNKKVKVKAGLEFGGKPTGPQGFSSKYLLDQNFVYKTRIEMRRKNAYTGKQLNCLNSKKHREKI